MCIASYFYVATTNLMKRIHSYAHTLTLQHIKTHKHTHTVAVVDDFAVNFPVYRIFIRTEQNVNVNVTITYVITVTVIVTAAVDVSADYNYYKTIADMLKNLTIVFVIVDLFFY